MKYLAVPTSPAASPPNECDSAVRCGTAVSGTQESGTPMTVPITKAMPIHLKVMISWCSRVPRMAAVIAKAPATTPRRAVLGELSHFSEKTNNAVAAR